METESLVRRLLKTSKWQMIELKLRAFAQIYNYIYIHINIFTITKLEIRLNKLFHVLL